MNEDFDKRDPLWKTLGAASPVKVRESFVDEVRAAVAVESERSRSHSSGDSIHAESTKVVPIRRSGRSWAYGLSALAAAACLVLALVVLNRPDTSSVEGPAVVGNGTADPLETRYIEAIEQAPDADEALESFYYINNLLAEKDVSALDDEAIVALLY